MQAIQDELIERYLRLQLLLLKETEELAERGRRERPGLLLLAGATGGALIMLAPLVIRHFFFKH